MNNKFIASKRHQSLSRRLEGNPGLKKAIDEHLAEMERSGFIREASSKMKDGPRLLLTSSSCSERRQQDYERFYTTDGRPNSPLNHKRQTKRRLGTQGRNGDPTQGDNLATQTQTSRNSPIDEAPQPDPFQGPCEVEGGRESTATINIATYNIKTLSQPDDFDRMQEQLKDFSWSILGLCETKRK
ncbi:hypothetical protein ElyMa_002703000 [Elysia marginata]|uniref:Caspase family p20 domain-containing protein n=1 Tax=Elysia marginata TaxID=1093978 RepID=A0AAV4HFZ1_9GAST|nr:hypothetical protein ElyMa_002703000 [Elysia marginata]